MTSFDYIVTEETDNERIDKILTNLHPEHSRSQIQRWITTGHVTVNDQKVKSNYKCQKDDELNWTIPEKKKLSMMPEDIPLSIVYEDEDLLVVNKPKGMVVHPTADHQEGTLVHALLHHSDQLSKIGGIERPGIVHRIDRDTSGLLVVAKKDAIHLALVKQLEEKEIERIYEAIVHGIVDHEEGLIDAPIGRDPANRLRMGVVDSGKDAVTHFQVLQRFEEYTHIACQLETGRTHQIRVHMDYINHPLLGDPKYTRQGILNVEGQALFARKLGFMHPGKNEWMEFEVEQPVYFQALLTEINRTQN